MFTKCRLPWWRVRVERQKSASKAQSLSQYKRAPALRSESRPGKAKQRYTRPSQKRAARRREREREGAPGVAAGLFGRETEEKSEKATPQPRPLHYTARDLNRKRPLENSVLCRLQCVPVCVYRDRCRDYVRERDIIGKGRFLSPLPPPPSCALTLQVMPLSMISCGG